MPDPKLHRDSIDPAKLPAWLRAKIDKSLPIALANAIYSGCHEADFLLAADFLMQLSLDAMGAGIEPSFLAARQRVREARIHLSDFSTAIDEMQEKAKPGLVVADAATL